jgi:hypothetical protein
MWGSFLLRPKLILLFISLILGGGFQFPASAAEKNKKEVYSFPTDGMPEDYSPKEDTRSAMDLEHPERRSFYLLYGMVGKMNVNQARQTTADHGSINKGVAALVRQPFGRLDAGLEAFYDTASRQHWQIRPLDFQLKHFTQTLTLTERFQEIRLAVGWRFPEKRKSWETSARLGLFSLTELSPRAHKINAPMLSSLWLGQTDKTNVFFLNLFYAHLDNNFDEYIAGGYWGIYHHLGERFKISYMMRFQHYKLVWDNLLQRFNRLDFGIGLGF